MCTINQFRKGQIMFNDKKSLNKNQNNLNNFVFYLSHNLTNKYGNQRQIVFNNKKIQSI